MKPVVFLKRQLSDAADAVRYFTDRSARTPFGLAEYGEGFRDHADSAPKPDRALIKRLLDAYHRAKADEGSASEPYRVRGEWRRIIDVEYARLLDALKRRDEEALGNLLSNFCRNECSRGLDMSAHFLLLKKRPLARFLYIAKFNRSFRLWNDTGLGRFEPSHFALPPAGNPIGMRLDSHLVPLSSIRHRYYAMKILEILSTPDPLIIEIGGGYGGLAYYLQKGGRSVRYADFDLPEINVVNGYFLLSAFPDKRIALYGEQAKPLPEVLASNELTVYPHFTFPQIGARSADLVFNSNSLTEMDELTVREYYAQITRISNGYFYHVNHDDEIVYDTQTAKKHVKLSRYGLEDSFETVYAMKPFPLNKAYFEYLYKRKA